MQQNPPGIAGKAAVAVLEVVATERPEQLPWLVETLRGSARGRVTVLQIAADCGVGLDQLAATISQAARDLDTLRSQYRRRWQHPREIVESPNAGALYALALARVQRYGDGANRRAWLKFAHRLYEVLQTERHRAWIVEFIGTPAEHATSDGSGEPSATS